MLILAGGGGQMQIRGEICMSIENICPPFIETFTVCSDIPRECTGSANRGRMTSNTYTRLPINSCNVREQEVNVNYTQTLHTALNVPHTMQHI